MIVTMDALFARLRDFDAVSLDAVVAETPFEAGAADRRWPAAVHSW
jgi:hypothetical protein